MKSLLKYLVLGLWIGILLTLSITMFALKIGNLEMTFQPKSETTIESIEDLSLYEKDTETYYEYKSDMENHIELSPQILTLHAVGDILLDRGPESKVKAYGFDYLFKDIKPLIESADISFANLECPASFLGKAYKGKPKSITFRADPSMLYGLRYAGFDIVSLANNHAYDYYSKALSETMNLLDLMNINYTGAGRNIKDARTPVIIDKNGITVAFLGYTEAIWSTIEATEDQAGILHLKEETILKDISETKNRYKPDYLIISIHWGIEHKNKPRKSDIETAHKIIDAGADIILGHHPHVLQSIENYNGGLIFYSLGNFVFDMKSSKTYKSIIARITFSKNDIISAELIPVKIIKKKYYPTQANEKDSKDILDDLKEYSQDFNTSIKIEENIGIIELN